MVRLVTGALLSPSRAPPRAPRRSPCATVEEVLAAPGVQDVLDADVDALPSDAPTDLSREEERIRRGQLTSLGVYSYRAKSERNPAMFSPFRARKAGAQARDAPAC